MKTRIPEDVPNSAIERAINEYVRSERDRAIMKRRLIDGALFEELAEQFDLSVRGCKNIVYHNMEVIIKRL